MADTGYTMNPTLTQWLKAMTQGLPGTNLPIKARNVKLYSRKNIGISTAAPTRISFFDETPRQNVQTIIAQQALPANMAMAITGVRCGFVYGLDRDGQRLGLASPSTAQKGLSSLSFGASAAAGGDILATQWKATETIREFMSTPVVRLGISTDQLWEVQSLLSLPDGKGSLVQAGTSSASTSATAAGAADVFQSIANGAPYEANMWKNASPWPLAGNEQFSLEAVWPRAVDFADADIGPLAGQAATVIAGTLTMELQGILGVVSS